MVTDLNRYLDAAVLQPEMTRSAAIAAIESCVNYHTRTVCVRPCDIDLAARICRGTDTGVCAVLAFPHGTDLPEVKQAAAKLFIAEGTDEIDMVVNYGFILSGLWELVTGDIESVAKIIRGEGKVLKVILETCFLDARQIHQATEAAAEAGANFVKTSTGFAAGGATLQAARVMLQAARGRIAVKASGGIRSVKTAMEYIRMGCTRLGTNFKANATLIDGATEASGERY